MVSRPVALLLAFIIILPAVLAITVLKEGKASAAYTNSPPISLSGTIFGLTLCSESEIYKVIGGAWLCSADNAGAGTDGNNYSMSIGVSGTTTKTINIERFGMPNISATWTDIDTDTNTVYPTYPVTNLTSGTATSNVGFNTVNATVQMYAPKYCLNTACSSYIYNNGTNTIIIG